MSYSLLIEEVYKIIEEIPQEKIEDVLVYLRKTKQGYINNPNTDLKKEVAFERLKKYKGIVPSNIDIEKERKNYLEKKHGFVS